MTTKTAALLVDPAENSRGVPVCAGQEEQLVGIAIAGSSATERQCPQSRDRKNFVALVTQCSNEFPGRQVVSIDVSIGNIADEQHVAEFAEIAWGDRNSPRIFQLSRRTILRKGLHQSAGGTEDVHSTAS